MDADNKPVTLSFGLGTAIAVNAIIGLPTFKKWKLILDLDAERATSKSLNVYFDLCFEHAARGLPKDVTFDSKQFIRPARQNATGLALLTRCAAAISTPDPSAVIINLTNGANDS